MKKFYFFFNVVLLGLATMLSSCSNEEFTAQIPEQETEGWHSAKLKFNVMCEDYGHSGATTRAASYTWKDGDVVYLLLTDKDGNKVQAYVKYDGTTQDWGEVIYDGYKSYLTCSTERVAEAYFLEDTNSLETSTLSLNNAKAIYACTDGSYVYPSTGMTVTVALKPLTGRIRFEGTAGLEAAVSGIKTFSTFSTVTGKFTESNDAVNMKVAYEGSTPYLYALFAEPTAPSLTIVTDKTYRTVFDPSSTILQPGKSGFMALPTDADHRGWKTIVPVTGVTLNMTSLPLQKGATETLTATVSPAEATDKTVIWTSSNTGVATVDNNGKVTAVAYGTAIITVTSVSDGSKKATCSVSVIDADPNGHAFVDLGLSSGTLWATMNVGAASAGDYGDYFAWGETSGYNGGKTSFLWSTYKWCNGSSTTMTKYCTSSSYGKVDNKIELDIADDAARANWGGSWMMPTQAQFQELKDECTWTWTTQGGNNGYKVTSKKNSNSIFLPAAGYRTSSLSSTGTYGYYWSRSLSTSESNYAYVLYFYSSNTSQSYNRYRYYGLSVRPILNK